jgi:hypothetical protein
MNPISNSEELSKSILQVAKNIEYIKVLYEHQSRTRESTIDEKAVKKYEQDIRQTKWNIIDYLSHNENYDNWLKQDKNNSMMFFKYFKQGHYEHEIGLNQQLNDKINHDLEAKFVQTDPKSILTTEEISRIKHAETNLVPTDRFYQYKKENLQILKLYEVNKCYDKDIKDFKEIIKASSISPPLKEKMNQLVDRIEQDPIFLKGHPAHTVGNPNNREFSLSIAELRDTLNEGENSISQTIDKLNKSFDNIVTKKPILSVIRSLREQENKPKSAVKYT